MSASFHRWLRIAACIGLVPFLITLPFRFKHRQTSVHPELTHTLSSAGKNVVRDWKPIESIQVGQRVLAENPQVRQAEREQHHEPNWCEYLRVELGLKRSDGTLLEIQMLRSEDWVLSNLYWDLPWDLDGTDRRADDESHEVQTAYQFDAARSAERATIPLRATFIGMAEIDSICWELTGRLPVWRIDLALPELGIIGPACLTGLYSGPDVTDGPGQVVTATFKHAAGDVIDLIVGSLGNTANKLETIGTTSNHPFWSADRSEFVQAIDLRVGERLRTFAGESKRVVSKLPRPGPETVFNLEVFGEHVYHVGLDGILVHNTANYDRQRAQLEQNSEDGSDRERRVQEKLERFFANASVQRERLLRTADGKKAIDPITGEGRRIDHVVIENGKVRYMVETTSKTASKGSQQFKEDRIRANGGVYIRDKSTRKLIDVSAVITRLFRRR